MEQPDIDYVIAMKMTASNELKKLQNDLNRNFFIGESTNTNLSITGEPYIVLTSGGIKKEGDMSPVLCSTQEKAIELFCREFKKYAESRRGKNIYWPTPIKMETVNRVLGEFLNTLYYVSGRLLISDKPVLKALNV